MQQLNGIKVLTSTYTDKQLEQASKDAITTEALLAYAESNSESDARKRKKKQVKALARAQMGVVQ